MDSHQLEDARRNLLAEVCQVGDAASVEVLLDLRRQILPDAGNIQEPPPIRHTADVLGQPLHRLGRTPVCPHAKRVLLFDLQEVGDLVEETYDLRVLHLPPLFSCPALPAADPDASAETRQSRETRGAGELECPSHLLSGRPPRQRRKLVRSVAWPVLVHEVQICIRGQIRQEPD